MTIFHLPADLRAEAADDADQLCRLEHPAAESVRVVPGYSREKWLMGSLAEMAVACWLDLVDDVRIAWEIKREALAAGCLNKIPRYDIPGAFSEVKSSRYAGRTPALLVPEHQAEHVRDGFVWKVRFVDTDEVTPASIVDIVGWIEGFNAVGELRRDSRGPGFWTPEQELEKPDAFPWYGFAASRRLNRKAK